MADPTFDFDNDAQILEWRGQQADLVQENRSIYTAAQAEKRDLDQEEAARVKRNSDVFDALESQINLRTTVLKQEMMLSAPGDRETTADDPDMQPGIVPAPLMSPSPAPVARSVDASSARSRQEPARARSGPVTERALGDRPLTTVGNGGFRTFSQFLNATLAASSRFNRQTDPRLRFAADANGRGQEAIGEMGGVLVPPDYKSMILQKVMAPGGLLSRCYVLPTTSNKIKVPKNETAPWGTAGGVRTYWRAELSSVPTSVPKWEMVEVELNPICALVGLSDEMVADAPLAERTVMEQASIAIDYSISEAIIRGDGVGKPLGILNSSATIAVPKVTSQASDTVVAENVLDMYARLPASSRRSAVWIVNQDVEAQLPRMNLHVLNRAGTDYVSGTPVYVPPNGFSGSPYATIFGIPVIVHEAASELGEPGDIILADLSKYIVGLWTNSQESGTGISLAPDALSQATSIHLWFLDFAVAYRFSLRIGGQPMWKTPITRAHGSNVLSPYIVLEAR